MLIMIQLRTIVDGLLLDMYKIILLILFLWPSILCAEDWSKTDTSFQGMYTALLIADWMQTKKISKSNNHRETNIMIGDHPSEDKTDLYFTATAIINYQIAKRLSKPYRRYWQSFWTLFQFGFVEHNRRLGFKVGLNF